MAKRDKVQHPRTLLDEGTVDLHSIIHQLNAHINWPHYPETLPAHLIEWEGKDNILTPALPVEIKSEHIKVFGLILDADKDAAVCYQRVRRICLSLFPNLPASMPTKGLVIDYNDKRFGLWIMPDNVANGDLETFLKSLVRERHAALWELASASVERAIETGAPCKGREAKARLYTWLAWQEKPGQSPGTALKAEVLDPRASTAQAFVAWFKQLYQLQ